MQAVTLSNPSKMPGLATMLPPATCKRGSRLRKRPDTVCSKCYACKGRFVFPNVQAAMSRQYDELQAALHAETRDYVTAVAQRIAKSGKDFRHFASGDFQSASHVGIVCEIARRSPKVKHWAATREVGYVREYLESGGTIPRNLVIRVSADVIDRPAPDVGLPTSTVVTSGATCDANKRGGECGACRKCWSRRVKNVAYPLH